MEEKLFRGNDYYADVGDWARVVAAIALTPFTILFSLMAVFTPLAALGIFITQGDVNLATMVLMIGLGVGVGLALPLCWITLRLYRGNQSKNYATVLPAWLLHTFLLTFLGPLTLGMAYWFCIQAAEAVARGNGKLALFWLLSACGWVIGWLRAVYVAWTR